MNLYKSHYTTLVVSGCSFTANNHTHSCSWANVLADQTGMNVVNLAVNAAGNQHIANSLILYLEKNKPNPKNTLVMPMWSGVSRTDFITDRQRHQITPRPIKEFHYDNYNQLYSICDAEEKSYYGPWAKTYKLNQSAQSLSLQSWLEILKLTNYLQCNSYNFKYLSFTDILYGQGISKIEFLNELKKLNLEIDLSNWLLIDKKESLGEFSVYNNLLCDDGIHPSLAGHELWLEKKLIPALMDLNIIQQQ